MRTFRYSMIALTASAFAASMAVAQQSQPGTGGTGGGQSGAQMKQGQQEGTGRPLAMSQEKLRQTLQKAGFSEIRVLDAAYLVHARTTDGDVIVMTINPPSMAALSGQMSGSTSGSGAGAASGQMGAGSTGSATGSHQPAQDTTKQKQ